MPSPPTTTSLSVTQTINGWHSFTIKDSSLAKGIGKGKHIASDTFTVGGYQWAIYFYPDGKNPEDNSGYVSVFIALSSDCTDVRVGKESIRFIATLIVPLGACGWVP